MNPYNFVVEKAAALIVDSLIGSAADSVLSELKPEFQKLHRRLDSIQESLEQQRSMWLRSALSFLRLGEIEKARDELVRATASDDRDALSRLVLGLLLATQGKAELAEEYLSQAWRKNPFLLLNLIERRGSVASVAYASLTGQWSLSPFPTEEIKEPFQVKNWLLWLLGARRKVAALAGVSTGPGHLIVLWQFASELDKGGVSVLSTLDLENGACRWSIEVEASELILATPEYIVLTPLRHNDVFHFYLTTSGAACGEMRRVYFETIFCPDRENMFKSKPYVSSHYRFRDPATALEDFRIDLKLYRALSLRERKVVKYPSGSRSECAVLTSLFGERQWVVDARNEWKYCTRQEMIGKFTYKTVEYVRCISTLKRQE